MTFDGFTIILFFYYIKLFKKRTQDREIFTFVSEGYEKKKKRDYSFSIRTKQEPAH